MGQQNEKNEFGMPLGWLAHIQPLKADGFKEQRTQIKINARQKLIYCDYEKKSLPHLYLNYRKDAALFDILTMRSVFES